MSFSPRRVLPQMSSALCIFVFLRMKVKIGNLRASSSGHLTRRCSMVSGSLWQCEQDAEMLWPYLCILRSLVNAWPNRSWVSATSIALDNPAFQWSLFFSPTVGCTLLWCWLVGWEFLALFHASLTCLLISSLCCRKVKSADLSRCWLS